MCALWLLFPSCPALGQPHASAPHSLSVDSDVCTQDLGLRASSHSQALAMDRLGTWVLVSTLMSLYVSVYLLPTAKRVSDHVPTKETETRIPTKKHTVIPTKDT